jgi:hypothetical protein
MGMIEQEVLAVGDDAMKSQYQVVFPSGIPGGGNGLLLSFRQKGTFDPPAHATGMYEVIKKGQKVPFPSASEETDKQFTLTIRLDRLYQVYDALNGWHEVVYNKTTGSNGFSSQYRTTVIVQNLDQGNIPIASFRFSGTYLESLKVSEFDHESGDPMEVECIFKFARMVKE